MVMDMASGYRDNGIMGTQSAAGVQFEVTLGAIYFMQYPSMQYTKAIKKSLDRQWHRWKIVGDSSSVTFYLDDKELPEDQ